MARKLSDSQKKTINRLHRARNHNLPSELVPHNTGRSLEKLGLVVRLSDFSWSLAESGIQLARELFADPTPPQPASPSTIAIVPK